MKAFGGRGTLAILSFAIFDLIADVALRATWCVVGDAVLSVSEDASSFSGDVIGVVA